MPKLRWDCEQRGCFNLKKRPKIEVFDDCFLYGCAFGDVDGVVERNGHFLFLEWKEPGSPVSTGQKILHLRLTAVSPKVTVLLVFGNAETMAVSYCQFVHNGTLSDPVNMDLEELKKRVMQWFFNADQVQS